MIASKSEIKALAFGNNFDINGVKDNLIDAVEWQEVLPLLGQDLYDDVSNGTITDAALIDVLKPYIAYNVKLYLSKSNHVKTGNKGAQIAQGTYEQIADVEEAKREAMSMANLFKIQIKKWLVANGYATNCTHSDLVNKQFFL